MRCSRLRGEETGDFLPGEPATDKKRIRKVLEEPNDGYPMARHSMTLDLPLRTAQVPHEVPGSQLWHS